MQVWAGSQNSSAAVYKDEELSESRQNGDRSAVNEKENSQNLRHNLWERRKDIRKEPGEWVDCNDPPKKPQETVRLQGR